MVAQVPDDALADVFSAEVRASLLSRVNADERLAYRVLVLSARFPDLAPAAKPRADLGRFQAECDLWGRYLTAAFEIGLFDPPHGQDLRSRLTGQDEAGFWSALAECTAAWLIRDHAGVELGPRPTGRKGRVLEFLLREQGIHVEVKAPRSTGPMVGVWAGDEAHLLARALREANNQFSPAVPNLLVVVPHLRFPVYLDRGQLLRAFLGEQGWTFDFDAEEGRLAGPAREVFVPSGAMLNPRDLRGRRIKPDGTAPYTRVGGVLCIELRILSGPSTRIEHDALLVHNPNALHPLPTQIWGPVPEFREFDGGWRWSDQPSGSDAG